MLHHRPQNHQVDGMCDPNLKWKATYSAAQVDLNPEEGFALGRSSALLVEGGGYCLWC